MGFWACGVPHLGLKAETGGLGARPEGQPGSPPLRTHPPTLGPYLTSPALTSCLREVHTEQFSGVLCSPVFLPTLKGCTPVSQAQSSPSQLCPGITSTFPRFRAGSPSAA